MPIREKGSNTIITVKLNNPLRLLLHPDNHVYTIWAYQEAYTPIPGHIGELLLRPLHQLLLSPHQKITLPPFPPKPPLLLRLLPILLVPLLLLTDSRILVSIPPLLPTCCVTPCHRISCSSNSCCHWRCLDHLLIPLILILLTIILLLTLPLITTTGGSRFSIELRQERVVGVMSPHWRPTLNPLPTPSHVTHPSEVGNCKSLFFSSVLFLLFLFFCTLHFFPSLLVLPSLCTDIAIYLWRTAMFLYRNIAWVVSSSLVFVDVVQEWKVDSRVSSAVFCMCILQFSELSERPI